LNSIFAAELSYEVFHPYYKLNYIKMAWGVKKSKQGSLLLATETPKTGIMKHSKLLRRQCKLIRKTSLLQRQHPHCSLAYHLFMM
jgi:hypothetical protein